MIVEIQAKVLRTHQGVGLGDLCQNKMGVLIQGFWKPDQTQQMAKRLNKLRKQWTFYQGALDCHSYGNALFGFRSLQKITQYHETAARSDQKVQKNFPQLKKKLLDVIRLIEKPRRVMKRKGFSGPGFIIYDGQSHHHKHYDINEGLSEVKNLFPKDQILYTCVGMIQKPIKGGKLFLWDQTYQYEKGYLDQIQPESKKYELDYPEGSFLIVNGMKLHEVEPCVGERITVNFHIMRTFDGNWTYWF